MIQASLRSLGGGAAVELFDVELRKALENIGDPNTKADAPRVVMLKVKITPNEERSAATVAISAGSKLAEYKPFGTVFFLGTDGDEVQAYENNPKQKDLAGKDGKSFLTLEDSG